MLATPVHCYVYAHPLVPSLTYGGEYNITIENSPIKHSDGVSLENNVQHRYLVNITVTLSYSAILTRYSDITGGQPISPTDDGVDVEYMGRTLCTDIMLADITPMLHSPILSRYLCGICQYLAVMTKNENFPPLNVCGIVNC